MTATATRPTHRFQSPALAGVARTKLAALRQRAKQAAQIGGDQETSFEKAFASLAFTFLKDRAPRLLDYMVGFQLVERNDDNTKAVGVFGFKLSNAWLYAPVFFMSGDLKGHELLYLKRQDMFVPLKENWVNYVLSKKPRVLGEGRPESLHQMGVMQPDIRGLSIPPHNMKYSSVVPQWPDWAQGFAPLYGALTTDSGLPALRKHAGFTSQRLLQRVVRGHIDLCKRAMDLCEQYPAIGEAFERFHGPDFFAAALRDMKRHQEKLAALRKAASAKALGEFQVPMAPAPAHGPLGAFQSHAPAKLAAGPPVEIHVNESIAITKNGPQLSEEEYERLLRDGHLIKDRRTGEEVSKAYNTQILVELVNPDETGLYELVQRPGDFVKCLVIQNPQSGRGREDFSVAVRMSPKAWINAHPTALWGKPNTSTREDFEKWYDKQSDARSLDNDTVYLAVSRKGEGSTPFRVRESLGDGRYRVHFLDYPSRHRAGYLPAVRRPPYCDWDSEDSFGPEMVFLNDREGTSFRSVNGTLYLPKECKLLTLKAPEKPKKDEPMAVDSESCSADHDFIPGTLADLQAAIIQKTAALRVYGDMLGAQFSVNRGPWLTKRAALFCLVRDHGFRELEAREMLRDAASARLRGKAAEFRVKYAGPYDQMVGPGPQAPAPPPQQYGYESTYGHVPAQYMEEYRQSIPEMSAANTDPQVYNPLPEATPDPMAMQQAQEAAQTGQKEIFDTSMITGLLKTVRQDSMVQRYLGDLLKCLDRLGRILFLFYWHNEEFAERYGKGDLPELEDSLRNTFEGVGDLCLFLQEKDIKPLGGLDMGEPSVEDSAD